MSCSSAGAILRGTGLGLEYERPRRRRILRSVRGLACLPVSLPIISFTMSRRHDAGPSPYLKGSLRVHPIIFLSVCGFRIFFLPVDFRSNLPPMPRHPDEPAANGGVRLHQFTCNGPYFIALLALAAGDQDVPSLAGGRPFDHAAKSPSAGAGKKPASLWKPCFTANRRARRCHADAECVPGSKPFGQWTRASKNSDGKLAKHFGLYYA